ncbi:MAG: LysM peptidoglycan-binding domain-containing protein, partial [Anaerolineae bacterium]
MRRLIFIFTLLLGMALTSTRPLAAQSRAQETFDLVNQVRAEHGLAPFQWNDTLARAAQWQANYIAANNLYSHTGENGTRPQDRANAVGYQGYVVENYVAGWQLTPQQGVTWWINSPVHYNTLISTRYYEAGMGYAFGNDQHWYVLVVGRRSDQPIAPPTTSQPATDPSALVIPITLSPPREDGSIVHEVQEGQTLWAIAARYEVRLDTLLLYNNLTDDSFIQPGDALLIRLGEGQEPPPTPTPPLTHVVREGETAWTIAARYGISLSDFFWYNGLDEDDFLQPGEVVTVQLAPGQTPPPTPTPQMSYSVQSGDTLLGIAVRFGLSLPDLLAYNGLTTETVLQPGDVLLLVPPATPTIPPPPT